MSNERKHHTPDERVAILRRHLVDRVPVSTLCDEHQLHPTVFYSRFRSYDHDSRWTFSVVGTSARWNGNYPRCTKSDDLPSRVRWAAPLRSSMLDALHELKKLGFRYRVALAF